MIEVRIGYDNISHGGSAQWCTFYIEDDFKSFLDYDGEKYYKNKLAPVKYKSTVQKLRESFVEQFPKVNGVGDLDKVNGVLYVAELIPSLPY